MNRCSGRLQASEASINGQEQPSNLLIGAARRFLHNVRKRLWKQYPDNHRQFRRFHFERDEDVSGQSGTGRVVEGCQFSNGKVAIDWLTDTSSLSFFDSIEDVEEVHGHGGKTRIVWDD
jgi:hypothetical protein